MFETHFLSSSIIFINNIKEFFYSLLTSDEETMTNRKLIKANPQVRYKQNIKS